MKASKYQEVSENDKKMFPFKPTLSSASAKIAESLETDFMERQMLHVQRRQKLSRALTELELVDNSGERKKGTKRKEVIKDILKCDSDSLNIIPVNDPNTPSKPCPKLIKMRSATDLVKDESIKPPVSSAPSPKLTIAKPQRRKSFSSDKPVLKPPVMTYSIPDEQIRASKRSGQWTCALRDEPDMLSFGEKSKSLPLSSTHSKVTKKALSYGDRFHVAKMQTDLAIKHGRVFTIQGGYHWIRQSLRQRGWVEKFFVKPPLAKQQPKIKNLKIDNDDNGIIQSDDTDDNDDDFQSDTKGQQPQNKHDDSGIYGIMSRLLKYTDPTFYWVLRRDYVDYKLLRKDQIINHYSKAGSFTTKIGLCVNLRNISSFEDADSRRFFPRCYRLCHDDDKADFIDDYHITTCVSILQIVLNLAVEQRRHSNLSRDKKSHKTLRKDGLNDKISNAIQPTDENLSSTTLNEINDLSRFDQENKENIQNLNDNITKPSTSVKSITRQGDDEQNDKSVKTWTGSDRPASRGSPSRHSKSKSVFVPKVALHMAIDQAERYIRFHNHDDIDTLDDPYNLDEKTWTTLLTWYYQLRTQSAGMENITEGEEEMTRRKLEELETLMPQFRINGTRNVWILKPGAKSRGRGIVCYSKLEDILNLVKAQVTKADGKYVIQKYIERPLLIYNTKFDIRQWFLVTDWNPLTVWFYRDCYLRFCSQQFTLENFDESIHLSNNSVQKHYKNGPRSENLPTENMWTHLEFLNFLRERKQESKWNDLIYPGMKRAVIGALMSTQDNINYRKASFELYGADFMLTEDYSPWLIEINSSPSMEKSTKVTAVLCKNVLEDTIKVVIDHRDDKNADIGRFELAYRQPFVFVPNYVGLNISVEGQALKRHEDYRDQQQPLETCNPIPCMKQPLDNLKAKNSVDDDKQLDINNQEQPKPVLKNILNILPETKTNMSGDIDDHSYSNFQERSKKSSNQKLFEGNCKLHYKKNISDLNGSPKNLLLPPVKTNSNSVQSFERAIKSISEIFNQKDIPFDRIIPCRKTPSKSYLMSQSNTSFGSKSQHKMISRKSVANSYPLPIPLSLTQNSSDIVRKGYALPTNSGTCLQGNLALAKRQRLSCNEKNLSPGGVSKLITTNDMNHATVQYFPFSANPTRSINRCVSLVRKYEIEDWMPSSRITGGCFFPLDKEAKKPKKGIFIHPSGF